MVATRVIDKEIRAQKRIISGLKREIFGVDKTSKSLYIREFIVDFSRYRRVCTVEQVIARAAACDIVYFGDYHPLELSQRWVLRFMTELTGRGRKVVLALEMLYVHQQAFLDQWMKGTITESQFLEAIDYYSEWGFRWESYRRIFEHAKDPLIPIFGIDSEPRDHLKYIRVRDRLIARRLETIRNFFPDYLILVVVGESHLASNHLPAELRRLLRSRYRETVIVQNIDSLYWQLLRRGRGAAEAVAMDEGRFCIFTTSPMLKYESYRQIINYWIEGERGDRQTPVLLDMVDNIMAFLYGTRARITVTLKEGWTVPLDDAFPDVQFRKTYRSCTAFLRRERITPLGVIAADENLKRFGTSYIPLINSLLIVKFETTHVAREVARFVVHAMRGEIGRKNKIRRSNEDRFYAFVCEEALSYFGSKIINPTQDCSTSDPLLGRIGSRGMVREAVPRFSLRETRSIVASLKYHFGREKSRSGLCRTTAKLRRVYGLPIRKRCLIVRSLGHTLGEAMYRAFHRGTVTREDIVRLYRERFDTAGRAKAVYREWVTRTKPFRGNWGGSRRTETRAV